MSRKTLVAVFSASGVTKKSEKRSPGSQGRISMRSYPGNPIRLLTWTG